LTPSALFLATRRIRRAAGAPLTFVTRTLNQSEVAVTQIVCNIENNGLTAPIPRQDAFLVTLQLRECPSHDLCIDGKPMKTGHLAPSTTCIYDLRQNPVVNSISPFRNLHFFFSRAALTGGCLYGQVR
jgi:AraC family transcriptional regulator